MTSQVLLAGLLASGLCSTTAAQSSSISFTQVGGIVSFGDQDDTPVASYIDSDGAYFYQSSHSLYGANDSRQWSFYTGSNMDTATLDNALSNYANPSNALDSNGNTTWRCNNSPTGKESTRAPAGSGYVEPNYCDLVGVWVDPDTGDWIGLVHNEFTPEPYHDGIHFDAIDWAVSHNHGQTWNISGHAITSPYATIREDNVSFPEQTYYYGDGDPRLTVDIASGFFYLFYSSRVVDKGGPWVNFYQHVARAPMSSKMATGSWQKWYDGNWDEPGVGGKESNMVPIEDIATGYTPPDKEYSPLTPGTAEEQLAQGTSPPSSPLLTMDVSWNAYLGLWIGEPQSANQSANMSQLYYGSSDLTTQKWSLLGNSGDYKTGSWYRWMLDSASKTSGAILGKEFRVYCSVQCAEYPAEYITLEVNSTALPKSPVSPRTGYHISTGSRLLSVTAQGVATSVGVTATNARSKAVIWEFSPTGDGAYVVSNQGTGKVLGVASTQNDARAWGAVPHTSALSGAPSVGQQWWIVEDRSAESNAVTGSIRLVNRFSGLVLALSSASGRLAETTPARSWTDQNTSGIGAGRKASEQCLGLKVV